MILWSVRRFVPNSWFCSGWFSCSAKSWGWRNSRFFTKSCLMLRLRKDLLALYTAFTWMMTTVPEQSCLWSQDISQNEANYEKSISSGSSIWRQFAGAKSSVSSRSENISKLICKNWYMCAWRFSVLVTLQPAVRERHEQHSDCSPLPHLVLAFLYRRNLAVRLVIVLKKDEVWKPIIWKYSKRSGLQFLQILQRFATGVNLSIYLHDEVVIGEEIRLRCFISRSLGFLPT